jgi:16S rRNA (adenine1518-N6/adenine1519-N6)-dimethyltransferase
MIKPIKDLGQNFLRNTVAITKIVSLLEIKEEDKIVEIGPGEGVLTFEILKNSSNLKLTSIDVDDRVAELLVKIEDPRFKFILGNILRDEEIFNLEKYKVIGAIPYNITSPIIHKIIEQKNLPEKVVLVVQKEVAEKITDKKRSSYLSNYIKMFFEVNYEFTISRNDFYPAPKVDSAVITFIKKEYDIALDKSKYSSFLHKVFRSPRKKINKVFSKEELIKNNIDENLRPENLSQEELMRLFNAEKAL